MSRWSFANSFKFASGAANAGRVAMVGITLAEGVGIYFTVGGDVGVWVGTDITRSPKVERELKAFFERHGVRSVAMVEGNIGCPHEEGMDYPEGEDCPFCPFWKGKQGSNRRD